MFKRCKQQQWYAPASTVVGVGGVVVVVLGVKNAMSVGALYILVSLIAVGGVVVG